MLIGVDGAMLSMVEQYLAAGSMPILAGLLNEGAAVEALPSVPVDTPTNWTTIATGAEPVSHGINSFIAKWAGEELTAQDTERARSMQSTTSRAELLWETVGRHGGSSLVINYPVGWPPKGEGVRVIGGDTPGGVIWHKTREELYAQGPGAGLPVEAARRDHRSHTAVVPPRAAMARHGGIEPRVGPSCPSAVTNRPGSGPSAGLLAARCA